MKFNFFKTAQVIIANDFHAWRGVMWKLHLRSFSMNIGGFLSKKTGNLIILMLLICYSAHPIYVGESIWVGSPANGEYFFTFLPTRLL